MKVRVLVDLSVEELKELDDDGWIRKNGTILEREATAKLCAKEGCYKFVGVSEVYCPEHTVYEEIKP